MAALVWLGRAELVMAVVLSVGFVVRYVVRAPWRVTPTGRQLVLAMTVAAIEAGMLALLGFGVRVPVWALVVVFGLVDVALARWWILMERAQARDRELL